MIEAARTVPSSTKSGEPITYEGPRISQRRNGIFGGHGWRFERVSSLDAKVALFQAEQEQMEL
jgi:hypothetical protein